MLLHLIVIIIIVVTVIYYYCCCYCHRHHYKDKIIDEDDLIIFYFFFPLTTFFSDPVSLVRDHNIKQQLVENGICVSSFNGDLLYEPWDVYDEKGRAFTNFDAYWDKCMSMTIEPACLLPPWRLVPPAGQF